MILRRLFSYPADAIRAALPATDDPLWDAFAMRQHTFETHRQTRSIVLRWPVKPREAGRIEIGDFSRGQPQALTSAVLDAADCIRAHFDGWIVRLMLAELKPGGTIPRHRDKVPVHLAADRCHLPIITNPGVRFALDDVDHHLAQDEVYWMDNARPHAVWNEGETPRVHMICDVMPNQASRVG